CPVPAPVGSCCHPKISYVNESGVFPVQCLDSLTEYKCDLLQGTWSESHSCDDLTEAQCSPYGACCYDDNGTAKCANGMLKSNCTKLSGTFFADRQCGELSNTECDTTPEPEGACCLTATANDGSRLPVRCVDARTQIQCNTLGGTWYKNQACKELTTEQCPSLDNPTGACCSLTLYREYTCTDNITKEMCSSFKTSEFYENLSCLNLPENSPCYGNNISLGVCCGPYGGCLESVTTPTECIKMEGIWRTDIVSCDDCLQESPTPIILR
ncbi:hypothetical protein, partial [Desulfobacter latus]